MKKRLLYAVALVLALIGGYGITQGIKALYRRSLPQEKLMRTLEDLTNFSKQQGYMGKEAFVLSLAEGSQIVLLGSIQGNVDSLKLIVAGLQKAGMLSDSLELKSHTYLIVNGNALGSDYSQGEVLELITQLMKRNPQRMWYLRGPEEDMDTLASSVTSVFGASISPHQLKTIQEFMATLPLGIYVFAQNLTENPLRISPYDAESTVFDRIACTTVTEKEPIKAICHLNELCFYTEGELAGIIDSNDATINWTSMEGLEQSETSWHLISSPTLENAKRYGYDISAYAVIDIGTSLATSFLTLYHTGNGKEAFVQGTRYQLGAVVNGSEDKKAVS